jgi:hypothetical protein
MLFPNKQIVKNTNFAVWVALKADKKRAVNFNEIKLNYEIKKNAFCKHKNIIELKKPFFLFRLKQWKLFSKNVLKTNQDKTMVIWNKKLQPKVFTQLIKSKKLLTAPKNVKRGVITNFNIQKKQQFRGLAKNVTTSNVISLQQINQNKPNQFLFIHPEPNNPIVQEAQFKQFPIISTENLSTGAQGTFPLFLNIFKHQEILIKL